jgi:hypothetical protein
MFAYPTASTLGLGLDLGLTPSSTVSLPILSANGSFAVESYTPSEGCAGILITVSLTSMLPVNDREPTDELRLIINDKRLCSRVEYDSNGNATLRALLSTSLASLCGLVPMSLHLHRDGELFDYCNFGHFNFVPVPMSKSLLDVMVSSHLTHSLQSHSIAVAVSLCIYFFKAESGR